MRYFIVAALLLFIQTGLRAEVDPNFYVYLCFGQSNMEGNAAAESVDKTGVDNRFQMLATTNFDSPSRKMGTWYKAVPPIVSPIGGIGMADYFGRTMVAALPAEVRVGVVDVAIGGCAIQMFDKDKYQTQLTDPSNWSAYLANTYYGGNPYQRLIDMARKAQETGVIKGILLHQGCSNNGDPNWPTMVKKIYEDILTDLELSADSVPLFVGETLREEFGGACYGHNNVVAKMPQVVPTSHVISSEGCEGNGTDPWHFCAMGYRIMGKRYAFEALRLMGRELKADADYQRTSSLRRFFVAKSLDISDSILAQPGSEITAKATFQDGHTEDVTGWLSFAVQEGDIVFEDDRLSPRREGDGLVEVTYTDFARSTKSATVRMRSRFMPLSDGSITQISGTLSYDAADQALTLSSTGQAGWVFDTPADMSDYHYLVLKLKEPQTCNAKLRVHPKSTTSSGFSRAIDADTLIVVDLTDLHYSSKQVSPDAIGAVTFKVSRKGTIRIADIYLSNEDVLSGVPAMEYAHDADADDRIYNLQGQRIVAPRRGVYIQNGKKILK